MNRPLSKFDAVTITLNPAIDRTITIASLTPGAVNRVEQEWTRPGGKGVNVASALADDGHRVAATGFLGRENDGHFRELFAEKAIEDCFVRIPGNTRTGIKITDPARNETTDINFPGLSPSPAQLDLLHGQLAALDAEWFMAGGSIPPGVTIDFYAGLIRTLKERGGKVVIDASGEALRHAVEAGPDIIKPNIHELEALTDETLATEEAVIEAARKLLAKGIELVAVSMGGKGACFVTCDEVVVEHPPRIEIKSTVGAGDAMVAGIIAARLRGMPLAECARLATQFSVKLLKRNATR